MSLVCCTRQPNPVLGHPTKSPKPLQLPPCSSYSVSELALVQRFLSNELMDEERKLTQTDNAISCDKTSNESEKTNLLLGLAEQGVLGYFRLVAKRH